MEIPGIDSILFKPATLAAWPDERSLALEVAHLHDRVSKEIGLGHLDAAIKLLDKFTRADPEGSLLMRLCYQKGRVFAAREEWPQAFDFYEQALGLATDAADYDSMIMLILGAAGTLHERLRYGDALTYYEIALATWHVRIQHASSPRVEPEVTLLTNIGRQQWLIGEFEHAQATVARALALAMRARNVPRSNDLNLVTANVLWTLGLIFRAQSDMLDGDIGYLHTALRRMRKALGLYEMTGTNDNNLGRFHIQIAEVHLDLAEIHLTSNVRKARAMRRKAISHLEQADMYLEPTRDKWAKLLVWLAHLRATVMWPLSRAGALTLQEIESSLEQIEREAVALNDVGLIAKTATVRAEWLLSLGDIEGARASLLWALEGYQNGRMGMATRAQRLLRSVDRFPPPADGRAHPSKGPGPHDLYDPYGPEPDDSQN